MEEQKINVCRALAAMFAEHEVTDEEVAFVGQSAAHLGLDEGGMKAVQQAFDAGLTFTDVVAEVTEPILRQFLFAQVVAAALTDDQLTEAERGFVNKTATAYGWDQGSVAEFMKTKQQVIELERKAQEILGKLG